MHLKKKSIIAIIISVVVLAVTITVVAYSSYDTVTVDGIKYYVYSDHAEVASSDWSLSGNVVLPEYVNDKPLTKIGENAFKYYGYNSITGIEIPDSVTSIGSYAFFDNEIAEISIPDGVTEIGDHAFAWCENLESVVLPSGLTEISNGLFAESRNLKSVTIPYGITDIYSHAFCNTGLVNIVIPDSVTNMEYEAFAWCEDLESVVLSSGLTRIDGGMFYCCESLQNITIPDSITEIGNFVFNECTNLETVVLPSGLTKINNSLFYGCTNLKNITLPDGITFIGDSAFSRCGITEIKIPVGVKDIKGFAFSECENLKTIELPEGINEVDYCLFTHCPSLEKIIIPDSVVRIKNDAFADCKNLKEVVLVDGLKYIGSAAFAFCPSLEQIRIPSSVKRIDQYAFIISEEVLTDADCEMSVECTNDKITIYCEKGSHAEKFAVYSDYNYQLTCEDHVFYDWSVVKEPTLFAAGEKARICANCGFAETADIAKLEAAGEVSADENGISIVYPENAYPGSFIVTTKEIKSGNINETVKGRFNDNQYMIFDIETKIDGETVQPDGSVMVKVPLPQTFNDKKTNVYYVTEDGKLEKVISFCENGYVCFEASHFSAYAIVEENGAEETKPGASDDENVSKFEIKLKKIFGKLWFIFEFFKKIFGAIK